MGRASLSSTKSLQHMRGRWVIASLPRNCGHDAWGERGWLAAAVHAQHGVMGPRLRGDDVRGKAMRLQMASFPRRREPSPPRRMLAASRGAVSWRHVRAPRAWKLDPTYDWIILVAQRSTAAQAEPSAYGTRYRVDGPLTSPDRRNPLVSSVWIILDGETAPRFVTAFPC